MKKSLTFSGMFLALALVVTPVLAETSVTANGSIGTGVQGTAGVSVPQMVNVTKEARMAEKTAATTTQIACVGVAVATREVALGVAVKAHADAVSIAYATRANELAGAYANTTTKTLQAGVKVSWADFTKSVRSAQKTWATSRNAAWSAFRTAVSACKASAGVSDSSNSSSEVSGQ